MKTALGTLFCALLVLSACATPPKPVQALYDPNVLPSGPVGESIEYGHDIIIKTPLLMKRYVRADMTCADCHIAGGTQARGGSFVGVYARFPQWNRRARRVITLQDRIAECFLYSMNGTAPAYASKEMVAIVAYIAWLSRGVAVGWRSRRATGISNRFRAHRQASNAGAKSTPRAAPDAINPGAAASRATTRRCGASVPSIVAQAWRTSIASPASYMRTCPKMRLDR